MCAACHVAEAHPAAFGLCVDCDDDAEDFTAWVRVVSPATASETRSALGLDDAPTVPRG